MVLYLLPTKKTISKTTRMRNAFILACCLLTLACTNQSSAPAGTPDAATLKTPAAGWTKEREMEFLADCVENAESNYAEPQAYALCKCMMGQVQQRFPAADSATLAVHMSDTALILQMIRSCQ